MSTSPKQPQEQSPASSLSPSNSISLIKLDELSSFGATKQNRLPALIKLNQQPLADHTNSPRPVEASSMPDFSGSQLERAAASPPGQQAESLPAQLAQSTDKENSSARPDDELIGDFQVVEMDESSNTVGPSLPAPRESSASKRQATGSALSAEAVAALQNVDAKSLSAQLQSTNLSGQYASHLGDSLIEMIINLRNENQNLVRALETNNEYVKERLQEFKRVQEEAKQREAQFALEKAEHEHQIRKLKRQNDVLSERLKSMESKLKDMKLEVSESLTAAQSSEASSLRGQEAELYPQLGDESFANAALSQQQQQQEPSTMQIDATSGELYNANDQEDAQISTSDDEDAAAQRVGAMSKKELSKHFDAQKAEFYALDDPLKQCDQLERQLNDIGKRDYEICLLQQQLNIYRQDFRLERMAKLEAKIQIERLKNDIDRLCLERLQERDREQAAQAVGPAGPTGPGGSAALIGKLGHHLSKKAIRSAAKAAKYAAKQAHLEEKAAAAMARAAAASSHLGGHTSGAQQAASTETGEFVAPGDPNLHKHDRGHHHHHRRGHHSASRDGPRPPRSGIRSEVVNDLLTTANKAMLTGYKMASTHVNLALDKLNQYEQQQAGQLDPRARPPIQRANISGGSMASPSAPLMDPPSID